MKEFLMTGSLVAALTIFADSPGEGVKGYSVPKSVISSPSDGFLPHERVTLPVLQEMTVEKSLLPDFGSRAYL